MQKRKKIREKKHWAECKTVSGDKMNLPIVHSKAKREKKGNHLLSDRAAYYSVALAFFLNSLILPWTPHQHLQQIATASIQHLCLPGAPYNWNLPPKQVAKSLQSNEEWIKKRLFWVGPDADTQRRGPCFFSLLLFIFLFFFQGGAEHHCS